MFSKHSTIFLGNVGSVVNWEGLVWVVIEGEVEVDDGEDDDELHSVVLTLVNLLDDITW